ncbi:uncharacterized protein LOC110178557 isoform X2 [Drosophila serrata]|uniref:uncharacterized protein LOC110178557 isoform X2 n=1 Tax=Drosophila serrata TaxID=7274 RepID=UPI000A1D2FEA|nr:uncharacterized protein LOC110178557 isoform X2 [Drosophila serrata]
MVSTVWPLRRAAVPGSPEAKGATRRVCRRVKSTAPLEGLSCDHWRFCEKVPRRSAMKADCLGSPVGLVCSNATIANPMREAEATAINFATYLKAFALIYVLPEVDWTAEKIDMLLQQGMELFRCSSETSQPSDDDLGRNQLFGTGIYTKAEMRIKRNFILEGHTFTMALESRYLGMATRPHIIKNLKCVLQAFFKSRRYCLLLTRVGHLLIWRRRKAFFVLDVKGRRRDDLRWDKDNGVAMLVCLKTVDNVVYLASHLSGITPTDAFTIRELVLVRLRTPDGRIFMRDSSYRSVEFKVVSKSYAYLKANLHLSLGQGGTVKNRSSLMVAVGSILASKIDHPANWDTNMLDRLICYGVELFSSGWSDCLEELRPIKLDTFPTQVRLGQFVVELELMPGVRLGYWKCLDIVSMDFEVNIREALEGFGNVVFQINNQMYAMWIKNDFYYLLDPYRHTIVGTHVEEDQCKDAKWATLRMFRDRLTMLSVFHQLLQQSNGQSAYSLHAVRIRNIAECPQDVVPSPSPEDMDTCDVESINEPILFSDQLGAVVQDYCLAEISDCECEMEDDSDIDCEIDLQEFQILGERQCAGAAENEILGTPLRSCTCLSQKAPIPTQEVSKSRTKSLKIKKKSNKTHKIENQRLDKKLKEIFKEMKQSVVSVEESKHRSHSRAAKKPVELTRKPNTIYETDSKRQKGGAKALAKSAATSKGRSDFAKESKDNWCLKDTTIIRLGTKVTASNLISQRDACIGVSMPSEGYSFPEDKSITKPKTISPQTSIGDILTQYIEKSNPKTVPSETGRQADQAPLQKSNSELRKAGRCNPLKSRDSLTRYPGYNREPQLLAVAGSESGTVESLNRLLGSAFKVANRVLTMTPWGNYVVFKHSPDSDHGSESTWFFLFDGCTCNIDRFRHLDLSIGTAGLLAFRKLSEVVCHMIDSRRKKAVNIRQSRSSGNACGKH